MATAFDKNSFGVTIVEVKLSPHPSDAGTDVLAVANSLRQQAFDETSPLRAGKITCNVENIVMSTRPHHIMSTRPWQQ